MAGDLGVLVLLVRGRSDSRLHKGAAYPKLYYVVRRCVLMERLYSDIRKRGTVPVHAYTSASDLHLEI